LAAGLVGNLASILGLCTKKHRGSLKAGMQTTLFTTLTCSSMRLDLKHRYGGVGEKVRHIIL
jgi:hypothetical protein